jgi:hypothetical protein
VSAPWNYPTLLRTPAGEIKGGFSRETVLLLEPQAYAVAREGETWRVTVKHTGEVIYVGLGTIELVASPAPF